MQNSKHLITFALLKTQGYAGTNDGRNDGKWG